MQAYGADSAAVVDVTDFFSGDTPALSGLSTRQREQFKVRRLDAARSYVTAVHSYPRNLEVRHTQTYEAAAPPSDQGGGALTLEMRQSLVLLPDEPMRPRFADARAGFFTVTESTTGSTSRRRRSSASSPAGAWSRRTRRPTRAGNSWSR